MKQLWQRITGRFTSRIKEPEIVREVLSPCVGICTTSSLGDNVCRGCYRFAGEILEWNVSDQEKKRVIDRRLETDLMAVLPEFFVLEDEQKLATYLARGMSRYPTYRQPLCWIYDWLKLYAPSLGRDVEQTRRSMAESGFRYAENATEKPDLITLKALIDQRLYQRAMVHYKALDQ